jgi:hypothetical protein
LVPSVAVLSPFIFSTSPRRTCGIAKDFTALGGKVRSSAPGVEPEKREPVEIGDDAVKLLTLGVGEVDKDAVLQPGKTQIDRIKIPPQQIVLEVLHILGCLVRRGIEPPGLCSVQEIIDKVNKLAARRGNFGNHGFSSNPSS